MIKNNVHDTVVDAIHQTRKEIAQKFDGDISKILNDARKRQATSGRVVWRGKLSSQSIKTKHQTGGDPVSDGCS